MSKATVRSTFSVPPDPVQKLGSLLWVTTVYRTLPVIGEPIRPVALVRGVAVEAARAPPHRIAPGVMYTQYQRREPPVPIRVGPIAMGPGVTEPAVLNADPEMELYWVPLQYQRVGVGNEATPAVGTLVVGPAAALALSA
jgi:hypothetical protein